jgi:flagellar protein FlgJ
MTRQQYVEQYAPMAQQVCKGTGIFPETLLAIAIIETQRKNSQGNYEPGASTLARKANNHFAIKATKSWAGQTITLQTPKDATPVSKFRAYPTVRASFLDFIKFLQTNPRYTKAGVFRATTWQDQIVAIARAGYAEGARYAEKLHSIASKIQQYIKPTRTAARYLLPLSIATLTALVLIYRQNERRKTAY